MPVGKVVIVEGPDKGKVVVLTESGKSYIMGRGKGTEIKLTDIQASRTHCMIVRKADKYICSDLQSRNGTIVNEKVIEGEHDLKSGDRITVGATTAEFQVTEVDAAGKEAPAGARPPTKAPPAPKPAAPAMAAAEDVELDEAGEPVEVTPLESGITNVVKNAALREGADKKVNPDAPPPMPKAKPAKAPEAAKPAEPAKPAKPAEPVKPAKSTKEPAPAEAAAPASPSPRIASKKTEKNPALPGKAGQQRRSASAPVGPKPAGRMPISDTEALESLDTADKTFARMAMDAEYVTDTQVNEASRIQRESSHRVALGLILVEKGHLDFEALSHIVELSTQDGAEDDIIRSQDFLFGRLCVQLGLISPNQLNECMMLQGKKTRDGEFRLLGALMVEKGFIGEEKVREVLRIHRTEMVHCHGCDALYKAADVPAEERDRCVECGASLKSG